MSVGLIIFVIVVLVILIMLVVDVIKYQRKTYDRDGVEYIDQLHDEEVEASVGASMNLDLCKTELNKLLILWESKRQAFPYEESVNAYRTGVEECIKDLTILLHDLDKGIDDG